MKSTLYLKFVLVYLVFGFLSFFTVGILTSQLLLEQLEKNDSNNLYKQAVLMASDYLPEYFDEEITQHAVHSQLDAMQTYLNSSIWFVDSEGNMITSSSVGNIPVPEKIEGFDPAECGNEQCLLSDYHGYFNEEVITVIAPVTKNFTIKGYLLIHKSLDHLKILRDRILLPVYITVSVIFVISFILLLAVRFFIYRPLQLITEAATQYASGNLDYETEINTHDEFGYLAASLNYMSSQLKDMEDYQKKIVANVSHDFRSPLTSIKGYVEAMTDGTIPPELHSKYLNIILFETERLTDLTKDLLTLNQFDTNVLLLNKTDFNIQDMIKHTAASFEGVCTDKRVSIELLLLPDAADVYADKGKIQQVLYNLIDNAIKFSEYESSITIEVTEKGEKYFISVKDHGIGIPKKDLNKIWERFYKSDLSRGKDKKGTGLGLAIVKEALQAHDEHINVISTEGVGTEFIFSLAKAHKKGIS